MRLLVRLLFILVAAALFVWGFIYVVQSFADVDDLQSHEGVIVQIDSAAEYKDGDKKRIIVLRLISENALYYISRDFDFIYPKLAYGDSVRLYTKHVAPIFGNAVVGTNISFFSKNPNEIFHLVKLDSNDELINFNEAMSSLRTQGIITLVISLVIFVLVFAGELGLGNWVEQD